MFPCSGCLYSTKILAIRSPSVGVLTVNSHTLSAFNSTVFWVPLSEMTVEADEEEEKHSSKDVAFAKETTRIANM